MSIILIFCLIFIIAFPASIIYFFYRKLYGGGYLYDFGYFTATVPGEGTEETLKKENWKKEEGSDILPLDGITVTKFSNSILFTGKEKVGESNMGTMKTSYYQDTLMGSEANVYYIPFKSEQDNVKNRTLLEDYFNGRDGTNHAYASYYDKNIAIIVEAVGYESRDSYVKKFKNSINLK